MSEQKIIAAAWSNYRSAMVPPDTSPEDEQAMRLAFYGGFSALWRNMTEHGGAFTDIADVKTIDKEVAEYLATPEFVVEIDMREVIADMAQRLIDMSAAAMRIDQTDPVPALDELNCRDRQNLLCAATGSIVQALSGRSYCEHGLSGVWRGVCTSYALTAMANSVPKAAALDNVATYISQAWDEELETLMQQAKQVGFAS